MAFCKNCGTKVRDGIKFCPSCGTDVAEAQGDRHPPAPPAQGYQAYQQPAPGYGQPAVNLTPEQRDIQDNKVMAVLAYILAPIPWFAAPNSRFARFYARQGMKLFIGELILIALNIIFGFIKVRSTAYLWGIPYETTATPWFLSLIVWLISIPITILAIIGLINAIQGKLKAPPLLDKIPLFK